MIFCKQVKFYESCKLIFIFWVGVARHARACPKCAEITNFWYFNSDLSYCFDFLHASRVQWELQISRHILARRDQACSGMPLCWNIKNFNISALVLSIFALIFAFKDVPGVSQSVSFCNVLLIHSCFTWLISFHGGGPFKLFLFVILFEMVWEFGSISFINLSYLFKISI